MPNIFDPFRLGDIQLRNRVVMAPLTRARAVGGDRVPNDLMVEYYRQRATVGLILTEATAVTPMGVGYADTPGIWSDEQVLGWQKITKAVHEEGGTIFLQLWHVGRISDPEFLNDLAPVAPSAIPAQGHVSLLRPQRNYPVPRALELDEIPGTVAEYKKGAEKAKNAGFDGVEIHGANGYLLDQFLQTSANKRTDVYGGSVENRARLMLEVTDACVEVWGKDRVGMHLAPRGDSHSMGDENAAETFTYVGKQLGQRGIAFICARESLGENRLGPQIKAAFGGTYIANESFDLEKSNEIIEKGEADAVAFGKLIIANPDLVRRFREGASLNAPDPSTFYAEGSTGYTDYPFLS